MSLHLLEPIEVAVEWRLSALSLTCVSLLFLVQAKKKEAETVKKHNIYMVDQHYRGNKQDNN